MTGLCAQVQAACDLTITDEQRRNRQSDKNSIQEGGTRMLKLCLTDGRQQLVGIEYRRLTGLHTDPPHGLKLVLSNVAVRRGVLLLTPDCAAVVGGGVGSGVMAPGSARPSPTGTAAAGGACGSHGISALPPPHQATSADPLAGSVGAWGCMDRQQRGGRAGDDEDAALFGEDEPSPSAARSRSTAEPEEAAARPRKRQSYSPPQPGAQSLQPQPAGQPPPYQPTPRQQSPCQPAPLPHHSGARLDWQHTAYPQPASRPSPPPAAIPISATARAPAAEASTGPFPSPGATRPADCASSAPGAPSPHRVPVAETTGNVGQPPLSLEAALLWGAGTPPMSERVRLEAVCQKVVKLSVDELRTSFAAEVLLSGGACERALPICEMLVTSCWSRPLATPATLALC